MHWLNAKLPIEVTDDGIEICFNEIQPSKEESPIEVTDDGIIICFNDEQSEKA
mgnify:CR=1 FL=1